MALVDKTNKAILRFNLSLTEIETAKSTKIFNY